MRTRASMVSYLLLVCVFVSGCLDPDLSGTRDVVVIASGTGPGNYWLQTRSVTADDFRALEGETVRLVDRPELVFDVSGETPEVSVNGDSALQVTYAKDGGTLVATDYVGLVAITTFHHMNESHAYFREIGLGSLTADVPQQRIMFLPTLSIPGQSGPVLLNDNMAFVFQINAFMLLAEKQLDEIPLAANQGVVAHEFSHSVLHFLTKDASEQPAEVRFSWDTSSFNHWRSVHEGLADVHGVGITNDPNFIAPSGRDILVGRDVSSFHEVRESQLQNTDLGVDNYDPYPLGSVLAATFWSYSESLRGSGMSAEDARLAMGRLAFTAVTNLNLSNSGFHIMDYLRAVSDTTSDGAWCDAVRKHFGLIQAGAGCP